MRLAAPTRLGLSYTLAPMALTLLLAGCAGEPAYDLVIRGGTIVDGSGSKSAAG